jgi:uncharacterized membrane protein (UPF0182 family)
MTTSENVRNELLAFQSGGSKPIYGNLLTLPVQDGLMYVQPVYATRELSDASFPELEFVIVSYGGQVGIGTTMTQALADVLGVSPDISIPTGDTGGGGGSGGAEPSGDAASQIRDLLARAQVAFDQADAALAERDPVTYAKKVEEARKLVEKAVGLAEQTRQPASPGPGN